MSLATRSCYNRSWHRKITISTIHPKQSQTPLRSWNAPWSQRLPTRPLKVFGPKDCLLPCPNTFQSFLPVGVCPGASLFLICTATHLQSQPIIGSCDLWAAMAHSLPLFVLHCTLHKLLCICSHSNYTGCSYCSSMNPKHRTCWVASRIEIYDDLPCGPCINPQIKIENSCLSIRNRHTKKTSENLKRLRSWLYMLIHARLAVIIVDALVCLGLWTLHAKLMLKIS